MAMIEKGDNFFTQLRKIAQTTERGVKQLQTEFENKNTDRCTATAVKKLIDNKKESKELKKCVRQQTEKLKQAGDDFDKLISLTTSLIDIENHKLTDIIMYMNQYGYKPKECGNGQNVEEELQGQESIQTNGNTECTPPHSGIQKIQSKTPKLEDFGLSEIPMRGIFRGENECRYGTMNSRSLALKKEDENQVPSIFQHNGLMCTPSVLNGRHVSLQTPFNNRDQIDTEADLTRPVTPEFLTPYTKKLMQNDKQRQIQNETTFQSPSDIMFKSSVNKVQQGVSSVRNHLLNTPPKMASLYSEMPQTPEMTCRFETNPLNNVTCSYNNISKSTTEEMGSKQKSAKFPLKLSGYNMGMEMPQTPELTCNFKNFTGSISPPQTTHLTEISKPSKIPSPVKLSAYSTGSQMPPSPELTCNFQSMRQSFVVEEPELFTEKFGTNKSVTPELPESLTQNHLKGKDAGLRSLHTSSFSPPKTPQFLCTYTYQK